MNSIINLYAYLMESNKVIKTLDDINLSEFTNNEDVVLSCYSIFKELVEYLVNLDEIFMMHSELNVLAKEIFEVDRYMLNSYKMINSNMLYDFYKTDYKRLIKIMKSLMK